MATIPNEQQLRELAAQLQTEFAEQLGELRRTDADTLRGLFQTALQDVDWRMHEKVKRTLKELIWPTKMRAPALTHNFFLPP